MQVDAYNLTTGSTLPVGHHLWTDSYTIFPVLLFVVATEAECRRVIEMNFCMVPS